MEKEGINMEKVETPNGMTIRQLKEWLSQFPDINPYTGEAHEVWVATGPGRSGPVTSAWPLNQREDGEIQYSDIILESDAFLDG